MSKRLRIGVFAALVALCVAVGAWVVVSGAQEDGPDLRSSSEAAGALDEARGDGRQMVVFRSLPDGRPSGNAQLALRAVDLREAAPTRSGLGCARVYFAAGRGLCIAPSKGFASGWRAEIFGSDLRVRRGVELAGLPSRTRVSPDGRYGAVTMFVAGHSYAAAGTFSTQTTLIDLAAGEKIADMEDFTVTGEDGRQITAIDVNFWGVTFGRDSDLFFATLATGGKTYLIRGSVRDRTAEVLKENVECPSLSPDGTRVAFKKRTGSKARPWRLTVLNLETMQETPLAEQRSIDDQAEWLDDATVLYGLDGAVWSVPASGSGEPSRFIAGADSPAVVRW